PTPVQGDADRWWLRGRSRGWLLFRRKPAGSSDSHTWIAHVCHGGEDRPCVLPLHSRRSWPRAKGLIVLLPPFRRCRGLGVGDGSAPPNVHQKKGLETTAERLPTGKSIAT